MNPSTIEEILGYLSEDFGIPKDSIRLDSRLVDDLNLDSIDAVDLMVKFQETTGVKVKPEQFEKIKTVQDLVALVDSLKRSA